MMSLKLSEISQNYKSGKAVLNNITAAFTTGISVITGPNGVGKTTLLRVIAGILRPSSGTMLWNGQDIFTNYVRYKDILGYLPQELGFYPEMTGREFLMYMAQLKNIPASLCKVRVEEVAEIFKITDVMNYKLECWSIGMKQRMGLAQAILNDPDLIILDEPLVGFDAEDKIYIWHLLSQLSKDRIIILSSNILDDYIQECNNLSLLLNGNIEFTGKIFEFIDIVRDKVWLADVSYEQAEQIKNTYPISIFELFNDRCKVRVICDTAPNIAGVRSVEPRIEDAYTYFVQYNNFAKGESNLLVADK